MNPRPPALFVLSIIFVATAVTTFGAQVRSVELLGLLVAGFAAGALVVAGVHALRRGR